MQRKYTVEELKKMRKAIFLMLPPEAMGTEETQISLLIEARLQTHILAGTDPEELAALAGDLVNAPLEI